MFKKTAVSLVMLLVFGAYSYYEHAHDDSGNLLTLLLNDLAGRESDAVVANTDDAAQATQASGGMTPEEYAQFIAQQNASAQQKAQAQTQPTATRPRRNREDDEEYEDDGGFQRVTQAQPTPAPAPAPMPTPAPKPAPTPPPIAQAPKGQYKDGSYTGPSVDVFYGYVQVEAIVQGGKIADVKFLSYPNDRNTSRYINSQAMPLLIQEAIQAQSAQIDGVSGASDTSQGFIESLGSALSHAKA